MPEEEPPAKIVEKEKVKKEVEALNKSFSEGIEKIRIDRPDDAEKIIKNITEYKKQMENSGYSKLYALKVCNSMVKLYAYYIDRRMPKSITSYDNSANPNDIPKFKNGGAAYDVIYHPNAKKMRHDLNATLNAIMEDQHISLDYMSEYLSAQQNDSWDESGLLMKGILLSQKEDGAGREYYLSRYDRDELVERAYCNPDFDKITESVAMYQAFTGIALDNIKDIPGLNLDEGNKTLTVYREISEYDDDRWLGMLDSTSLSGPWGISEQQPDDYYLLEVKVPISNVVVAYFLSPEFCEDWYSGRMFANEREIVADLSHLEIKILHYPLKREVQTDMENDA